MKRVTENREIKLQISDIHKADNNKKNHKRKRRCKERSKRTRKKERKKISEEKRTASVTIKYGRALS